MPTHNLTLPTFIPGEAEARATDLDISLCAVLSAEACNIGLTPLINPAIPALTRDRLAWT
jgi:hypothetical protein